MQIRTQKEGNINEMSLSMEEEALSNCKGLYDKSHKDFHRKDIKKNTQNAVAEEIGLEVGAKAEKEFTKLREKYNRYKRDLKKKEVSDISSAVVQKAKKKREELNYLSWLDKYTQPQKSKTNIEGELTVSQIASQVEENGGEFSDEQNDDSYQNTEDISQVNVHADGNKLQPSSLT